MIKTKKIIFLIIFQILIKTKETIPVINSISKLISIFPNELKDKFKKKNYQIFLLSHKIYNEPKRNDKIIFYCKDDENIFYIGLEVNISISSFETKDSIQSFLFSKNLSKLLNFFDLKLNDLNFIDSSENYTNDYLDYIKQEIEVTKENPILNKIEKFNKIKNRIKTQERLYSSNNYAQTPQSKYLNNNIIVNNNKKKVFNRNNKNEEIIDTIKEIKNISLKNNYDSFVNIKPKKNLGNNEDDDFFNNDSNTSGGGYGSKFNDYFLSFLH